MVLAPGEEESTDNHHSPAEQLQKIINTEEEQKKKVLPMNRCQQEFAKLSKTTLVMAKVFTMTYGKGEADCVDWQILGDMEYHYDTDFKPPMSSNVIKPVINFDKEFNAHFFEHIFPSVTGHATIIDKFLSDPRAPYYDTVKSHQIKFHDPHDPDLDWKVKQCYILLIAAVTEMESGVNNLWKSGTQILAGSCQSMKCLPFVPLHCMHGQMRNIGTSLNMMGTMFRNGI